MRRRLRRVHFSTWHAVALLSRAVCTCALTEIVATATLEGEEDETGVLVAEVDAVSGALEAIEERPGGKRR